MKKIIAIRHGEIPANVGGKLSGWLDQDLNSTGRQQAAELAASLNGNFHTIIASPLRRAVATANAIAAGHPCNIVLDPNLRERNFGSLSGKSWAEAEAETGKELRHLDVDLMQYDYRPYGGESAAQVIARVREFVHTALQYNGGSDVVAVTHGGVIKILYSLLESDSRLPITNCSVHIFYPRL